MVVKAFQGLSLRKPGGPWPTIAGRLYSKSPNRLLTGAIQKKYKLFLDLHQDLASKNQGGQRHALQTISGA
jgi:hypothetical protein